MTKNYTAGIDMGGTGASLGIVDRCGNIIKKDSIPTSAAESAAGFVDLMADRIMTMAARLGIDGDLEGIGIGAPCACAATGEITAATNLPWPSPIPIASLMAKATGLPVSIGNDANTAAIGEMTYGAARGMKDFIIITLGTGVGAGIVSGGQLIEGHRGFAGELGHIKAWRDEKRTCAGGRLDCLQTYCSASGVVESALRMLDSGSDSSLSLIPRESLSAKDIFLAAEAGDKTAARVLRFTGEVLGEACAQFAAFSDPEAIILFGGVTGSRQWLGPAVEEAFNANVLHLYRDNVRLLFSALADADAALLGASALAWNHARQSALSKSSNK